ncbi:MAG: alkaline phosphatase family protein [Bryobacteraceae bacterium]|jgi:YVTN family beta-propeller protein
MKSPIRRVLLFSAIPVFAAFVFSQPAPRERVGPLPDGSFLLNSFWRIDPVGRQIPVDTLPLASALSPGGKYLLVLNCGYRPPSVTVIESSSGRVVGQTPVPDAWLGMAFQPNTNRVYVSGGSRAAVYEFTLSADGALAPGRTFEVVPAAQRTVHDFIADLAFSPDGRLIYAADLYHDSLAVINPQSGMVTEHVKTGRRPYRILFHPDGKSFFVTSWADGTLEHYDAASGGQLARVPIGAHPTDMVWRAGASKGEEGEAAWAARLFVAAANTNNVYAVAVSESKELNVIETINVSMTPRQMTQPLGMTPSGLALSTDGSRLFVVCSDANAVAVADVSGERSFVRGFIPTGWYPTAARMLPSGVLTVLNGKGLRSYANPTDGPNPTKRPAGLHQEPGVRPGYVGYMQTGTVSWIEGFRDDRLEEWTKQAFRNSPYRDPNVGAANPLPPIQRVIYIVKENRTYDQVLGDMKEGNGDTSLEMFGENVTPNLHKLAREFVLFDNFYVNADVSASGHNWSTAAIAPDYVEKLWPNEYAGRRRLYDFEEQDPTSLPPAGYIWTNAAMAGISIRNFGYMVNNTLKSQPGGEQVASVRDPVLAKVTNRMYRGFDLDYPDVDRAKVFLDELAEYEKSGEMPRLIVMRLGNDHTNGTTPGKRAPLALAADNDYAVGQIAEAVSHSRFWTSTAIFILEDDAQNGPDHVDSHRSPAFLISAYVRRHTVDGTMYNTTSMLHTIELLLGLQPMTHFDANARPMAAALQAQPDPSPYAAEKPRISLTDINPPNAPGADASRKMAFEVADEIDEDALNDILWRAIRGTEPPPPVRSYFGR